MYTEVKTGQQAAIRRAIERREQMLRLRDELRAQLAQPNVWTDGSISIEGVPARIWPPRLLRGHAEPVPRERRVRTCAPRRSSGTSRTSTRDGPPPPDEDLDGGWSGPELAVPRTIPADRLATLVNAELEAGKQDGLTVEILAERCGVPARAFRRFLNEGRPVSFSPADRIICHALDGPFLWLDELSDLYGKTA